MPVPSAISADYHLSENRNIWNAYLAALIDEQFTQSVSYVHGSARNQVVHLANVDDTWFSGLLGVEISESLPAGLADRNSIRTHGPHPVAGLLHVVNHGADHP